MSLLKSVVVTHCLFLGVSVILNLILTKWMGQVCGLDIWDPSSWAGSFILVGSPFCRYLSWMISITTNVVENMWFHLISEVVLIYYSYNPQKNTSQHSHINITRQTSCSSFSNEK